MENSIITNRLIKAIELRGMSMSELARQSGIDKSLISRYLHGKATPKLSAIQKMSSVLGVSAVWMSGYDISSDDTVVDIKTDDGVESELKDLMIKTSGSVNKFSNISGLSCSTVVSMLNRGIENTTMNTVVKVCKALNISIDELVDGKIVALVDKRNSKIDVDKLTLTGRAKLAGYYRCLIDCEDLMPDE